MDRKTISSCPCGVIEKAIERKGNCRHYPCLFDLHTTVHPQRLTANNPVQQIGARVAGLLCAWPTREALGGSRTAFTN